VGLYKFSQCFPTISPNTYQFWSIYLNSPIGLCENCITWTIVAPLNFNCSVMFTAGRYTSVQSLVEVFHSVINGFLQQGTWRQTRISCRPSFNSTMVFDFRCSIVPNVIIQWTDIGWIGGIHPWWSRCSLNSAIPVWCLPCEPERRLAGRGNQLSIR